MARRISGMDPIRQRISEEQPPTQVPGFEPVGQEAYKLPESGLELVRTGLWAGLGFAAAAVLVNMAERRFIKKSR